MPKRSRSGKRSFKKGSFKRRKIYKAKRRSRKRSGYSVTLRHGLRPQVTRVGLNFAGTYTLTQAVQAVGVYQTIRANSLYDPNETGTGISVLGTARMFADYDHATVTNASIIVDFEPVTGSATCLIGILPTDGADIDSSALSSNNFRVTRRAIYKTLVSSQNERMDMKRMTYRINVAKFFGIKRGIVGDSKFTHTSSTNPGEQVFFQIFMVNMDDAEASTLPTVKAHVYIKYDAVFTEPKENIIA